MTSSAVRTDHLTRDFGLVRAVSRVSIDVAFGRVLALLGPNGAGKTTFLKLLMGLLEPTDGEAWVLGASPRNQPEDIASRIAILGDGCEPARWATLSAIEGIQAGASNRFDRAAFRSFCSRRDLKPRSRFGTLSKGQRQWVLSGLTLAMQADLLLMDEPATGLDPSARRDLYDCLRDQVTNTDATAIVATHIIGDIERVADDVAVIDKGRLVLHASLEDLREQIVQVELPSTDYMRLPGPRATLLGSAVHGDRTIAWVRCNGGDESELEQRVGPAAALRRVDLETMYLAISEHGWHGLDRKENS